MNVNTEQYFSEVPRIYSNRSVFDRSFTHKTTMSVNKLYPIFIDETLPGDSMKLDFQVFGRLINPLVVPVMDELYFETIWAYSPMILLWNNTEKFFGERENPTDDNDYVIPTVTSPDGGFAVDSIFDHFGIYPGIGNVTVNSLPFRFYNRFYNEWLRDQNLISSVPLPLDDTDDYQNYTLLTSAKMHDVFTSALPTTQLNGAPFTDGMVTLPIGGTAPVVGNGNILGFSRVYNGQLSDSEIYGLQATYQGTGDSNYAVNRTQTYSTAQPGNANLTANYSSFTAGLSVSQNPSLSGLQADLSQATGINVNDLRYLFKLQQYRERLLLGGHRYNEIIMQFFGVENPQTPYITEFLGMTREMMDINTVVQTSSTDTVTPQGNLTAYGVINHFKSGFQFSSRYHGYILGLARIRHNPVYQQGLNKLWSRSTQLDFYNPMFNGLGEQPIKNRELVLQSDSVVDENGDIVNDQAFGFNEAYYEYRYYPSLITGQLRSGIPQSLDVYHLAQYFGTASASNTFGTPILPKLNQSFIEEQIPLDRASSINQGENIPQFVMDFRFNYECARVMPVRNIPAGLYSGI